MLRLPILFLFFHLGKQAAPDAFRNAKTILKLFNRILTLEFMFYYLFSLYYSLFQILFLGNPEENQTVFAKHFDSEFDIYGPPITCVNLVEKTGREKIIGEAYLDNALALNRPEMNFVYFDFHEYCRGMKFENVNILIQALENDDYIKSMRYCWLDRHGVVCQQQGVFRINCIGRCAISRKKLN